MNYIGPRIREKCRDFAREVLPRWWNVKYWCLTSRIQRNSPTGRAPHRFIPDATTHLRKRPGLGTAREVIPARLAEFRLPLSRREVPISPPKLPLMIPPASVFHLRKGEIVGGYHGAVFTSRHELLKEFSPFAWGPRLHPAVTRFTLPRLVRTPKKVLLLSTPGSGSNYFHFTIDLVPRLYLLQQAGYDLKSFEIIIVDRSPMPFHEQWYQRLGINRSQFLEITPDLHLISDDLVVPSLVESYGVFPEWKRDAILSLAGDIAPAASPPPKRIFVTRKSALTRRLLNQDKVETLLAAHGFQAVDCNELTLDDQIRLFSGVTHIAAVHGAALTNLVYAREGTRVIEMMNIDAPSNFYWLISSAVRAEHHIVAAKSSFVTSSAQNRKNLADMNVNLDELKRVVEMIC